MRALFRALLLENNLLSESETRFNDELEGDGVSADVVLAPLARG